MDLAHYRKTYKSERPRWVEIAWFFFGLPILRSSLIPFSSVRKGVLRTFGARIGTGVVIKPGVRVKYPWLLSIGDYSWIGEGCWIDNLGSVTVGKNTCLSQGSYICTGNHDWNDSTFKLLVQPTAIGNECWVAAGAIVAPGVTLYDGAVLTAGSVATKDIPPFEIHTGNPAAFCRVRILSGTKADISKVVNGPRSIKQA